MMSTNETTYFCNVDLCLWSTKGLAPIAEHLNNNINILHNDYIDDYYYLSFETKSNIRGYRKSNPDLVIRNLIKTINSLPPDLFKLWNQCSHRVFDIGFQQGNLPPFTPGIPGKGTSAFQTPIKTSTLKAVANLKATINITIYPFLDQQ